MGALDCVSASNNGKMSSAESTEVFSISTNTLNNTDPEDGDETRNAKRNLWWNFGIDLPLLAIVIITLSLFEIWIIPCHKAGFFCNDPLLSYKYTGDTVSTGVLLLTALLLAPIVIFLTEFTYAKKTESEIAANITSSLRRTLKLYRIYLYGLVGNFVIIEFLKGIMGNPRPSFFDVCKPDTGLTCSGSEYVSTFECTSKFPMGMQMDSYRSFPSGHTSISVYCGLFIVWYLQIRAFSWRNRSIFLVPCLQLLAISYSFICSLTRITDHRHHWWDVLAGAVLGISLAFYVTSILLRKYAIKMHLQSQSDKSIKKEKTEAFCEII